MCGSVKVSLVDGFFKTVYWLLRQTFNVSALTEGSLVSIICVGGVSQESPVVTVRVCGD